MICSTTRSHLKSENANFEITQTATWMIKDTVYTALLSIYFNPCGLVLLKYICIDRFGLTRTKPITRVTVMSPKDWERGQLF